MNDDADQILVVLETQRPRHDGCASPATSNHEPVST